MSRAGLRVAALVALLVGGTAPTAARADPPSTPTPADVEARAAEGAARARAKDWPAAGRVLREAAALCRARDDVARERGLLGEALVYLQLAGDVRAQREVLERVRATADVSVPLARRIATDAAYVDVLLQLDETAAARAVLGPSLAAAQEAGLADRAAALRRLRARLSLAEGRLVAAVAEQEALLAEASAAPPSPATLLARLHAARFFARAGQHARALAVATDAAAAVPSLPPGTDAHADGAARVLAADADFVAAEALVALGRLDEASSRLAAARRVYEASNRRNALLNTVFAEARVARVAGRLDVLAARIAEYDGLAGGTAPARASAPTLLRAWLALARKDPDAVERTAAAVAVGIATDGERITTATVATFLDHACALLDAGRPREALATVDATTDLLAVLAAGAGEFDVPAVHASAELAARRAATALGALAARGDVRDGDLPRAWRIAETGRAVRLATAIAEGAPADPTDAEVEARRRHRLALDAMARAQAALVRVATDPAARPADVADARAAFDRASDAAEEASRPLGRRPDATVLPVEAADRGLDAVQAELGRLADRRAALVVFDVLADRMLATVVRATSATVVDLPGRAGLEADVEAWRELVAVPDGPHETVGRRLASRLLDPLRAALDGVDVLLVVASGPLAGLPLGVLPDPSGAPYVAQYALASVPSGATLVALGRRGRARGVGRGAVVVADPTLPPDAARLLPPLPHARDEAGAVASAHGGAVRSLVGDAATLEAFEAAVVAPPTTPWRAVHVATHGWADPARPRLAGLLLAGGGVWNGERVRARAPIADVVVLSACETSGDAWEAGEGVVGLVRPLLAGGAQSVVASAWRVPDASTAALMDRFHRELAAGRGPAAALREAQRVALRAGGPGAHPYAWAPFVVWGAP